jgi:GT2 family glycosyltransferase
MNVRVSVVVPTYRRPKLLDRCLTALAAQRFDPAAFEIVVADNAGSDETRHQVECRVEGAGPSFRYVRADHARGPAAARNAGWRAAAGTVLAFTDDDCVPDAGWLAAGTAALAAGAAAACGRTVVPLPPRPIDYERNESGLEDAEFITANCFCTRAALEAVGGFDERFAAAWREDSDLHFSLLEAGLGVVRAPDAVVTHPVRPARWGVSLGQQRKARYEALLYKKHPALYRQRIRPATPWDYYGITAGLLVAAAGAGTGLFWLAAAGAAGWLGLTARFCHRRLRDTSRAPRHIAEMLLTSALIPPLSVFWRLRGAVQYRVVYF